jgi:hypothetical protein
MPKTLTPSQRQTVRIRAGRRRYKSQPRIPGVVREAFFSSLHPHVKHGIRSIADREGRSPSWVMAEIVSMFFHIDCKTGKELIERPRLVDRDFTKQGVYAKMR